MAPASEGNLARNGRADGAPEARKPAGFFVEPPPFGRRSDASENPAAKRLIKNGIE